MRTPDLEERHHASAVVAKMALILCRLMLRGYTRKNKNIGSILPELLVVCAIKINDDRNRPPLSANSIAKRVGMPRANVRRALDQLVKAGVTKRVPGGYVNDDDYLRARKDAAYFKRIVLVICAAASELKDYN